MANAANLKFNLSSVEKAFRNAIERGLTTRQLKTAVENLAIAEIEKAVSANQNLFRPDTGPDGGDELVGLLGIGQGGRPLKQKYSGPDAAWTLLNPKNGARGAASSLSSSFRRKRTGKFGILNYEINFDKFFNNFRSTYISRKSGDSDFVISWMQNLIDGIPQEQVREYPPDVSRFGFISSSSPVFNPKSSRTGLGHMVALEKIKIPVVQFTYKGRGRTNTFGKLFSDIEKRLSSSAFKNKIEERIAQSINRRT